MDNRPIGFLDSGVGGLTVVRELMRQLPHEEIVYIGDSARAPYGPRPAEQIREYTWQLVNFLLTKDVKMIVIACNTATAVVWEGNQGPTRYSCPRCDFARSFGSHQVQPRWENRSDWNAYDGTIRYLPPENP